MVLLHNLKGPTQFECSKDMSCTFKLTPLTISAHECKVCGSCGADKMCFYIL